ncbi:hypothetical protein [Vibrio sinaloensis]|uniref:hypothetical protein n=1 Tax=Photobacterium sp. (strain ATCC 43367) TaxID=379097 RepID=UPI00207046CC|nr:hypothetical protein [Vibrio sinaloensis]UPQ88628.1 hypothetical protein MTO69_03525 [Vibrio sinaloensis]
MKRILFAAVTLLLAFGALANAGNSSQLGPFVDCQLPNGQTDYLPSMICKSKGGSPK